MPSLPTHPKPKRASRSPPLGDGTPLHLPVQNRHRPEQRNEIGMHVDIQVREPALCPQCHHEAQPRDLRRIVVTFGDGRSVAARFDCRSCGQVFETESLGLPQPMGRPVEDRDDGELEQLAQSLGTAAGTTTFLDRLRDADGDDEESLR